MPIFGGAPSKRFVRPPRAGGHTGAAIRLNLVAGSALLCDAILTGFWR